MPYNPEVQSDLPELRKSKNPAENKNNVYMVQHDLIVRYPGGDMEWVERYAARFRELYDKDESFRALVLGDRTPETLTTLQARLDEKD